MTKLMTILHRRGVPIIAWLDGLERPAGVKRHRVNPPTV
jgi:hypothetical protein